MIDFHCHILPGIDDGSKSVAMSLEMLHMEWKQGVHQVIATPHFYASKDSMKHFLERRKQSYETLMEAAEMGGETIPDIRLGAEVYYFRGIGQADHMEQLCIEGTKVLLLEMPFCQWEKEMYEDIRQLIRYEGFTVVLAHVERYPQFQKSMDVWDEIMKLPLYIQMNMGPFLNWNKKRKALRLLKEYDTVLVGSDAHNLTSRIPNLADGRQVIEKHMGASYLKKIDALEERLLKNE